MVEYSRHDDPVLYINIRFHLSISHRAGGPWSYFQVENWWKFQEHSWMYTGLICWLISSWLEMAVEPVLIYLEANLVINVTVAVEVSLKFEFFTKYN